MHVNIENASIVREVCSERFIIIMAFQVIKNYYINLALFFNGYSLYIVNDSALSSSDPAQKPPSLCCSRITSGWSLFTKQCSCHLDHDYWWFTQILVELSILSIHLLVYLPLYDCYHYLCHEINIYSLAFFFMVVFFFFSSVGNVMTFISQG